MLADKIKIAVKVRKYLNLPNKETCTFRLLNNEGYGLSGSCSYFLGSDVMFVMRSTPWYECCKNITASALKNEGANEFVGNKDMEVVWRSTPSRLKQDSHCDYDSERSNSSVHDDNKDSRIFSSCKVCPCSDNVQKTGFCCDQRVVRIRV